ncbi:hypothetical protein NLI96_g1124 [Meripilus lineatus]|uniref:Protein ARV n=1 Tax=Meripilus lineatus TaxID=2056292 RepID=A0AAD5VAQ1_9APHY|nr:hypothetical protein NLI96_g1124 [Physisporinus lineatus]
MQHDSLMLILDLILLKRDVYRHLLFNRGTGARRLGDSLSSRMTPKLPNTDSPSTKKHESPKGRVLNKERDRRVHILKLGTFLIAVDAFIRWTHLSMAQCASRPFDPTQDDMDTWNHIALEGFLRILAGCTVETLAFHLGVILASYVLLNTLNFIRSRKKTPTPLSGIRQEFKYSHIPLSLLYSSLTKLFLLFLLSIWHPNLSQGPNSQPARPLPPQYNASHIFTNPFILGAIEFLDEDRLDREWVVRNVLGGMAAGFGLRVVLDCHPIHTTMVIIAGWAVKTAVAGLVSEWVSGSVGAVGQTAGEMWLAYSIP